MAQATATVPEQARAGHCCQGGPGQGLPQVQRGLSLTCSQTLRRFKGQFSRQVNSRDERRAGGGESPTRQKMSHCSTHPGSAGSFHCGLRRRWGGVPRAVASTENAVNSHKASSTLSRESVACAPLSPTSARASGAQGADQHLGEQLHPQVRV